MMADWQNSLNQRLVERLQQPLNRPNLGQVLMQRTDKFLTRFSLVEQQFQRWGKFQAGYGNPVPIVLVRPSSPPTMVNGGGNHTGTSRGTETGRSPIPEPGFSPDLVIQRKIDPAASGAVVDSVSPRELGLFPLPEMGDELTVATPETAVLSLGEIGNPSIPSIDLTVVNPAEPEQAIAPLPAPGKWTDSMVVNDPLMPPDLTLVQVPTPEVLSAQREEQPQDNPTQDLPPLNPGKETRRSPLLSVQEKTDITRQKLPPDLILQTHQQSPVVEQSPEIFSSPNQVISEENSLGEIVAAIAEDQAFNSRNLITNLPLVTAERISPSLPQQNSLDSDNLPIVKARLEQLLKRRSPRRDLPTVKPQLFQPQDNGLPKVQPLPDNAKMMPPIVLPSLTDDAPKVQPLPTTQAFSSETKGLPLTASTTGNNQGRSPISSPTSKPTKTDQISHIHKVEKPIVETFQSPPMEPGKSTAQSVDIQAIAKQVEQKLRRKMIIEQERRGQGRWR